MIGIDEALVSGRPAESGERLLQLCAERVGTGRGSIYLLDPGRGMLLPFARMGAEFGPGRVEGGEPPAEGIGSLAEFFGDDDDVVGTAVYTQRESRCLGVIALPEVSCNGLEAVVRSDLRDWAALLGSIYEDERLLSLLRAGERIREIGGGRDGALESDFLEEARRVLSPTVAESVLLHAMEPVKGDTRLRCVLVAGLEGPSDMSALDLSPEESTPYGRAVSGTYMELSDIRTGDGPARPAIPFEEARACVVLPIRTDQVLGVLTIVSRLPFQHTPLELQVLQSLADSFGSVLANVHDEPGSHEDEVVAWELTSLDIVRAGRHEAKGYIDNCIKASSLLWSKCRAEGIDVEPELDSIAGSLKKAREALDRSWRMEAAWEESPRRAAVRTVWEEACAAFEAHLRNERIETRIIGPPVEVEVSSKRLGTAFLNLIINSIEAFGRGRRSGRLIELKVEPISARDRDVRLTYRDNGPGVNRGSLRSPGRDGDISQLLFEKGATSKKNGPGFGLWLVRKSLKLEGGSIDLLKSHDGARFAIRLPNPDNRL